MRTQKRKEKHRKNQILQNRIIRDKKKKKNFFYRSTDNENN